MSGRRQTLRPVLVFALSGLAVIVLVGVAGAIALRSLATDEALRHARQVTTVTGHGIVEPALTTNVVRGRPARYCETRPHRPRTGAVVRPWRG